MSNRILNRVSSQNLNQISSQILNQFPKCFDIQVLLTSLIALMTLLFCGKIFADDNKFIRIDGSSTVYPITEAVAEEFQTMEAGKTKVIVGISGTGGGFKKFCRGEIDIQDASRPIQQTELDACKANNIKFFELPIGFDAIVVAVHPQNSWLKEITTEELKKIWEPSAQGKITKWNQVNNKWPEASIKLFGAGSDSGTFDYFTEAVVGKAKSSRGDYTASEDDNTLIQGISSDKNALGYVPMSYYLENQSKIKALSIVGLKLKKAVSPNKDTVENGTYEPFSRPLFLYISENSFRKNPNVKKFTEFYLKNASKLVASVKYVALPDKVYTMVLENLNKGKLGSVFGGHSDVGMKIEDLMKKEAKF